MKKIIEFKKNETRDEKRIKFADALQTFLDKHRPELSKSKKEKLKKRAIEVLFDKKEETIN